MLQPNAAPYDRGKARIISVICRRGPRDGSSAFIFDLMEPKRPETDRKVLEFIKAHVFDPADFIPPYARALCARALGGKAIAALGIRISFSCSF
jgi:hypothetical protein